MLRLLSLSAPVISFAAAGGCNCGWTHGGSSCGKSDGSHCWDVCCGGAGPCDCSWTHGGISCGRSDGSVCWNQCCGHDPTPPSPPTPPAPPAPPSPPGAENPFNIQPNPVRSKNFFFIIGDYGAPAGKSQACQYKIAYMMRAYAEKYQQRGDKLLFVLAAGDNFYYNGLGNNFQEQFDRQWKRVYTSLTDVPWLGVYGNHDYGKDDPGCACGKGCHQFNAAGRPAGMEKFWIPDYYWHYLIPEVNLEVIGLDTNAVDVPGLGGDGCKGGASTTCWKCGGQNNIQNFLNQVKNDGERYLDERARVTPATTVALMQHYHRRGTHL